MTFRPAGGLYQFRRRPGVTDKISLVMRELDVDTREVRYVSYHNCPLDVNTTDAEVVTYDLDRAGVITWTGSMASGKLPLKFSRGGWS